MNAASLRQASVVFQASAEGILVLDHLRRIVSANESFYRLTGLSAESALGRDPDECLHVEPHDEGFYRRLEGSVDSGRARCCAGGAMKPSHAGSMRLWCAMPRARLVIMCWRSRIFRRSARRRRISISWRITIN